MNGNNFPAYLKDSRIVNQAVNNKPHPQHVDKRIELDDYKPEEMELYLFFQGYGRAAPDNILI